MCYQTLLSFCISLRETFSSSIAFTVINIYGQGGVIQISVVFGRVYHVACQTFVWNRTFLDIYLTTFFGARNFANTSAMRGIFYFENVQTLIEISKIQRKIEKNLFVFHIIAFELAFLICLF